MGVSARWLTPAGHEPTHADPFLLLAGCGSSSTKAPSALTDCSAVTDTWSTYGQSFFGDQLPHLPRAHLAVRFAERGAQPINSIESEISSGAIEGHHVSTDKARILSYLACGAPWSSIHFTLGPHADAERPGCSGTWHVAFTSRRRRPLRDVDLELLTGDHPVSRPPPRSCRGGSAA